jgi:hypothetical protein
MKKFKVLKLLREYRVRVRAGDVQFMRHEREQKDVVESLDKLIEAWKDAEKEAGEKKRGDISQEFDWHQVHEDGEELWKKLASYALNSLDPDSKGNSELFEFLGAATRFEDLLYGLEEYYRDHTLHSLWVYLIGEHLLQGDLTNIYKRLNWYLYNDIDRDRTKYHYSQTLVREAGRQSDGFCREVNKHKDATWCVMALCHDLGYSLEKLTRLNEKVQDVLRFFDVGDFRHVGYSLDIEHQYLMEQFLELMAMDVRIVPSDNFRAKGVGVEEKVLVKCFRDDSTYWRLCRSLEKKEHGILSAYLIFKLLGVFADTSIRGPAEEWGLDDDEVPYNIIRGDILFAIAQHEFKFAHLNRLSSLAELLIVADELEEFSRLGRQLQSRRYHDTAARAGIRFTSVDEVEQRPTLKSKTCLEIEYDYKHDDKHDFRDFFRRKAERLCQRYSLEAPRDDDREGKYLAQKYCTIESIMMKVNWKPRKTVKDIFWFHLSKDSSKIEAALPRYKNYLKGRYPVRCCDDEIRVLIKDSSGSVTNEFSLKEWLKVKKEE